MIIRPESPNDKDGIRKVLLKAFQTSAEADLVDRLRDAKRLRVSLVAVENEMIVGQIGFSDIRLEDSEFTQTGLGLGPLAVLPSHQKKGIGSILSLKGLEIATQQKVPFVVVLGSRKYYRRFGFELAQQYNLSSIYDAPKNFMIHYLGRTPVTFKQAMAYYVDEFEGV
jgi:putative acetyltransferase